MTEDEMQDLRPEGSSIPSSDQAVNAASEVKSSLDFHPIRIKGEPLSATILQERR